MLQHLCIWVHVHDHARVHLLTNQHTHTLKQTHTHARTCLYICTPSILPYKYSMPGIRIPVCTPWSSVACGIQTFKASTRWSPGCRCQCRMPHAGAARGGRVNRHVSGVSGTAWPRPCPAHATGPAINRLSGAPRAGHGRDWWTEAEGPGPVRRGRGIAAASRRHWEPECGTAAAVEIKFESIPFCAVGG